MKPFVHLHNHTAYSLLDGAGRISDEIDRAVELGMPALAITDHGVMYGAVEFYRACKKAGIKPIIGCEVYVAPRTRFDKESRLDAAPYHLILLVKNDTGYRNLCKLVTLSSLEGFYYHPRVDRELLQAHHEGLIAMSACLGGEVPRLLLDDDLEGARQAAMWYQDLFGEDYYFELQNHGIPGQIKVNDGLHQLSRELGVRLVATNDNHYVRAEDAAVQDVMLCIQTATTLDTEDRMRFEGHEFYFKSYEEMLRMLPDDAAALDETVRVAEKCNFDFTLGHNYMPNFDTPPGLDHKAYLRSLCEEGIRRRYPAAGAEVTERLDYELGVIDKMGYNTYFLIVWDFVNYAKSHGIFVGPGRGSAAGSIVSYLLGITDIDPLKYQLLFERFLNPERVSMPDIDIDFCYERRGEVIDYVARKYGADHVTQIITFNSMLAKGAVRDVGRVMNVPLSVVNKVTKLIPSELGITLDKAISASDELRALIADDEQIAAMIQMAKSLEGLPRNAGVHAAGVVISAEPADHYLPLQRTKEDAVITQYPKDDVEAIGLLKMDFLGLRTLTVVNKTIESIRARYGVEVDFNTIPDDDPETYQMLSAGDTAGVFQLEGSGLRAVLKELQPESLEDIIALVALYRPGPLGSGMVEDFIARKHGEQEITYLDPKLEPILNTTYGVILYQEQVMQIASSLCGFTLGEADMLRRAMGKKKPEIIAGYKTQFIEGAQKGGTSAEIAEKIFELIEYFAGYGFNKSHSAAYGLLAFQTGWLKCHYPKEFMAETLNSFIDRVDKMTFYISECRRLGIPVLPPDVNISNGGFTADDNGQIRFGLNAVKNVGRNLIENAVTERREKPYTSLYDFCKRMHGSELNRRAVESLIKAGAFDCFGSNRHSMVEAVEGILKSIETDSRRNLEGQLDLFSVMSGEVQQGPQEDVYEIRPLAEYTPAELLQQEKEVSGLYLSGHPLDAYREKSARIGSHTIKDLTGEDAHVQDGEKVRIVCAVVKNRMMTTKSNSMMAFTSVEDLTGTMEVIVFPKVLDRFRDAIQENAVVVIDGRLSVREDEASKLLADSILPIDSYDPTRLDKGRPDPVKTAARRVFIRLPSRSCPQYDKVVNLLEIFDGDIPVILYLEDTKQKLAAPRRLYTSGHPLFFKELERLLGTENVATK